MEYILFLTYKCNLNCSYCFAKNVVHGSNTNVLSISRDNIKKVCTYIENDIKINYRQNNSIVFFGGEPSLVPDIILDIMALTQHLNLNYSIYTNGLLLDKLPDELLKKLQSILVAIDGEKEIHETYKPVGSYEKILTNLAIIKGKTTAQTVGRITMEENSNIYLSVKNLLDHFDYVHWQIVNKDEFHSPKTMIENYKTNIKRLFDEWKQSLESGVVLNIIPFNRIVLSLLSEEKPLSFRCGCGSSIQAIDIAGNIYMCDEYIDNSENKVCNIHDDRYDSINYKTHLDLFSDCTNCDISSICLGRCRKSLENQSPEHIRVYCEFTRILVGLIIDSIEKIREIVTVQNIDIKKLHTEIYNTEIIP